MEAEALRSPAERVLDPFTPTTEPSVDVPVAVDGDEVLATTTVPTLNGQETAANGSPVTAVALSAVMEGLGQAYNRQPAKAVAFVAAGLTFSTASGLNTWLARNVLGLKRTRIGPDRVRPGLLALWGATYALSLVDAWRNAGRSNERAV